MAWLQVHQTLKDHRKTFDSADMLEIKPAYMIGLLTCFWLWALDNAPSGNLAGISARTIARAAGWPEDDADNFVSSIKAAGWLDESEDGDLEIHDWYDYAGKLIDQREAEKQRSRRRRAKAKTEEETTDGRPTDDQEKTVGRVDKTRVDKTRVDKTKGDKSPTSAKPTAQDDRFDQFWNAYPRKVGKKAAQNSWKKIKPTAELFEKIMQSLEAAKHSAQWQRENGQYIPHPTTWLNQGRWDDELDPVVQQSQMYGKGNQNTMDTLSRMLAEEEGGGV